MSFKLSFSDLLFIVLINGGKFSTENVLDAPYFLNWGGGGGEEILIWPIGYFKDRLEYGCHFECHTDFTCFLCSINLLTYCSF